jgi:hypothetical protein
MKTLVMTDERWAQLVLALDATPTGHTLLDEFGRAPELPSDRELVALARNGGDPPAAIALAKAYRDAGRQAATDTRLQLEELVKDAHAAGVGPAQLARWFGLKPTRVYEILDLKSRS